MLQKYVQLKPTIDNQSVLLIPGAHEKSAGTLQAPVNALKKFVPHYTNIYQYSI